MENEQRPTRGRLSKVDLLPDSIREQLHQMLREKRHTQEEIREAINALIDEHNLPEEMQLSRTGLNRYAIRMEKVGAKIRASREMAEVWAAKLGSAPTSDVGKLLMEFVKTLALKRPCRWQEMTNLLHRRRWANWRWLPNVWKRQP